MMYFDRKLTHWQFPVLFLDTKRKSLEGGRAVLAAAAQYLLKIHIIHINKLKKIIKEIENNDESTITVDKASYIALLREVNRLRFKCSQRGALSRSKKMACKDNSDDPEAVMV